MTMPEKPEGVPMDEWLLAIGLANKSGGWEGDEEAVAKRIAPHGAWADWSPAWNGAHDALRGCCGEELGDEDNPDAYAAGAALAMALEADA